MTTLNLQVSAAGDDGWQYGGVYKNGVDTTFLWAGVDASNVDCAGGVRFQSVTIPQGTTITSAKIDFYNLFTGGYATHIKAVMKGEAADNSAAFSIISPPSGRTTTTASVTWNSAAESVPLGYLQTNSASNKPPDVTTIVQEIINRGGWASGNSLSILSRNVSSDTDWNWNFESYDGTPAHAPTLTIVYTAASGGVLIQSFPLDGLGDNFRGI